ncbi:CRISPR-associated endoribonuclease Cas6 [Shouchella clausii]|nr:CRISPR-associated endoribonuclease Cas6 [Shouchella clausii]
MRIAVTYKVKKLPIAYRLVVLSFIKEALKRGDEAYFHELYKGESRKMKPFSYSVFLKNFSMEREEIHLSEITVTISSPDMVCMLHLFNGLQELQSHQAGEHEWTRTMMKWLPEASIHEYTVYLKTLSPVLIEDKRGNPVHPDNPHYEQELNYFASLRIQSLANREPYQELRIVPGNLKRRVIKESNSKFRESQANRYLTFTAYQGVFQCSGHPEDLQLLYQGGLGKRVSQGFGMLDYVGEGGQS